MGRVSEAGKDGQAAADEGDEEMTAFPAGLTPLDYALKLHKMGFNVLPVHRPDGKEQDGKRPALNAWKQYHEVRETEDEVRSWFDGKELNIAVIMGHVSGGCFALDFDEPGVLAYIGKNMKVPLERTSLSWTTGKGMHVVFKSAKPVKSTAFYLKGKDLSGFDARIDVQAEGKYIVAPSSVHKTGKVYTIYNDSGILEAEDPASDLLKIRIFLEEYWLIKALKPFWTAGQRNDIILGVSALLKYANWPVERCERIVEFLMGDEFQETDRGKVLRTYGTDHANYKDNLDEALSDTLWKILKQTVGFREKKRKDEKQGEQATQAVQLWDLVKDLHSFSDELEQCYVVKDGIPLPVGSRVLRNMMLELFYEECGRIPNPESIAQIESLCEFHARKNVRSVDVRVVEVGGIFYYDPLAEDGSVYRIDDNAVELVRQEMPVTVRWKGMLPAPAEEGKKEDLETFLRLWRMDEDNRILSMGFLGTAFVPGIPHVILNVLAEQGSGKSSYASGLSYIIDPSQADRTGAAKKVENLMIGALHSYVVNIDNVNHGLRPEVVDALARLCTGAGERTRKLFTDADEVISKLKRQTIVNGINPPTDAPDFIDRMLSIWLQYIDEEHRLEDKEIQRLIESFAPKIRGYVLHVLPAARRLLPEVRKDLRGKLPRMADFAVWGEASCRAMGEPPMAFFNAYISRQRKTVEDSVRDSILFEALRELILDASKDDPWTGNITQLLVRLGEIVESLYPEKDMAKHLPRDATRLSQKMNQLKPVLRQYGIGFEDTERVGHKGERQKKLFRLGAENAGRPVTISSFGENKKNSVSSVSNIGQYINSMNEGTADANEKGQRQPASAASAVIADKVGENTASASASASASVPETSPADAADAIFHHSHTGGPQTTEITKTDSNTVENIKGYVLSIVRSNRAPAVRDKNNIVRLVQHQFKTDADRAKTLIGLWIASGVLAEDSQDRWTLCLGPNAEEA